MKCPIEPEGTKCIIVPDEIESKTPSGRLWVPPTAKDQHQLAVTYGTLVGIGPRAEVTWNDKYYDKEVERLGETPAKVGDRIIFVKYAGTMVNWGGDIYQIVQDQDIIARMLEDPPATDGLILTPKKPDIVVPGR